MLEKIKVLMPSKYMMYSGIFIGVGMIIYGLSIKYRSKCVICGSNPPCTYNSIYCKPNSIEGKLLSYLL
jgi:hypothetical protein